MAYIGKEYKFEREENFKEFLTALGLSDEEATKYQQFRPNVKLTKNGDTYTYTTVSPQNTRETSFQIGVPFEEEIKAGFKSKSTVSVSGDTYTLSQDYGDRVVTYKREFTPDSLKVTASVNTWDGAAYRYYVPV